jgi:glucose-6-phosphate 1-dehydrogenase
LTYKRRFSDLNIPEAYEALLLDAFKGDHSNFVRDDELDASWRIFTPLLHYLDEHAEMYLSPSVTLVRMLTVENRMSINMDLVDRRYWMNS